MKKKGILITGITGLLGSSLAKVFTGKKYNVYDINLDISDSGAVANYDFKDKKIDWIIHTAAITNVDLCEKDKNLCNQVNFKGTKNIKDLAEKLDARLLYVSTVSVFSGEEGNYTEKDKPNPKNFYSRTKLLGERTVLKYSKGMVLRINLIGVHPKGSRGTNFFEWLVDSIKDNRDIQLFSDVLVNPLSNWTIAEVIKKIINGNYKEKILHIASRNVLSKADIAMLAIEKIGGYKGKIKFVSSDIMQDEAFRPKQAWLNSDYAQKKLNLKMPSLESEIRKILKKLN